MNIRMSPHYIIITIQTTFYNTIIYLNFKSETSPNPNITSKHYLLHNPSA